jgi:hypothetical protein
MQLIVTILQGINVVGTLLPSTMEAALAIVKMFQNSGTDFTVQVAALQDGAIKSSQETIDLVDGWKKANGYA